jgi:hypothetical protein
MFRVVSLFNLCLAFVTFSSLFFLLTAANALLAPCGCYPLLKCSPVQISRRTCSLFLYKLRRDMWCGLLFVFRTLGATENVDRARKYRSKVRVVAVNCRTEARHTTSSLLRTNVHYRDTLVLFHCALIDAAPIVTCFYTPSISVYLHQSPTEHGNRRIISLHLLNFISPLHS